MTFNPHPKPAKKKKKSTAIPKKTRKQVFKRDKGICQYCDKLTDALDPTNYLLPAAHCHHIVKRKKNPNHDPHLLNTSCWECHCNHGEISQTDKDWLDGKDVYQSRRMYQKEQEKNNA